MTFFNEIKRRKTRFVCMQRENTVLKYLSYLSLLGQSYSILALSSVQCRMLVLFLTLSKPLVPTNLDERLSAANLFMWHSHTLCFCAGDTTVCKQPGCWFIICNISERGTVKSWAQQLCSVLLKRKSKCNNKRGMKSMVCVLILGGLVFPKRRPGTL